jgi:hypothetical protein
VIGEELLPAHEGKPLTCREISLAREEKSLTNEEKSLPTEEKILTSAKCNLSK